MYSMKIKVRTVDEMLVRDITTIAVATGEKVLSIGYKGGAITIAWLEKPMELWKVRERIAKILS